MIDFDDAILTSYTVVARFHASLAQAEAGRLRLADSYSYYSDISRHISQTQQASLKDNPNAQKEVLEYLMSNDHSYEQKKASLLLAINTLEKQVHIFTLGSSNKAYSKHSFPTDTTNTIKKLLDVANRHVVKIEEFHKNMQQEFLSPSPLFAKDIINKVTEEETPPFIFPPTRPDFTRFGKK